jgi:hypothetical protein
VEKVLRQLLKQGVIIGVLLLVAGVFNLCRGQQRSACASRSALLAVVNVHNTQVMV